MYKVGDVIIYTLFGICKITEETERPFNGQLNKFFILEPLSNQKTKMTVPQDNPIILARLHSLLSVDEVNTLIQEIPFIEPIWIDNDNQRKREFGETIKSGDQLKILQIMKSIYTHSLGLKDKGRKLHVSDEQCMKDGEKLILDEFSYVLNRDRNELLLEIKAKFDNN